MDILFTEMAVGVGGGIGIVLNNERFRRVLGGLVKDWSCKPRWVLCKILKLEDENNHGSVINKYPFWIHAFSYTHKNTKTNNIKK